MHDPSRAPDVTVVNETPYDLTIKVSDEAGKDWMAPSFALVNRSSKPSFARRSIKVRFGVQLRRRGEYRIDRSPARGRLGLRTRVSQPLRGGIDRRHKPQLR